MWAAWRWWPPVLRYRIDRIDARAVRIEQAYLDGKLGLEPAAVTLGGLWKEKTELWAQLMFKEPSPGAGSLTAVAAPIPAGVSPNDPRLNQLGDSAMAIMMGPEAWQRLQRLRSASHDSK
jgi:hypothetical protein